MKKVYPVVFMELLERLAYYGMILVLGNYLTRHMGIAASAYGVLQSIFTATLYLLPVAAGAFAERHGYRRALLVAFSGLAAGYALLGAARGLAMVALALAFVAVGGSLVKPTISGAVTKLTKPGPERSSAFGLYYVAVNVGALAGPVLAGQIRSRLPFELVFMASAGWCILTLVLVLTLFTEPETSSREPELSRGSILEALKDKNFVALMLIFSGFWGMMNVLVGFLPVYIEEHIDLRSLESAVNSIVNMGPWLKPEVFVSLDALLIVLFQTLITKVTGRIPTPVAITVGTAVATMAWPIAFLAHGPGLLAVAICTWSLGEMIASPRFFEYCGSVAPPGKVAVYLGYSFLSIGIGNAYSGAVAGVLYQSYPRAFFFAWPVLMGLGSVAGLIFLALRTNRK